MKNFIINDSGCGISFLDIKTIFKLKKLTGFHFVYFILFGCQIQRQMCCFTSQMPTMTSKLDQLKNQDSATQFKSPKQVARNTALELSPAASTSAERGFVVRGARIRTWLTPYELWVSDFGVLGTTWNACSHQPGLRFIILQVCFLCLFTSMLCLNTTHAVIYKGQNFNFFSS